MDVRPFAVLALCLSALPLSAGAPFVAGAPEPLSERIARSRAAVIAEPADSSNPDGGWRVTAVLQDASGKVATGQVIRPRPEPPEGTRRAVVISNADRTVESASLTDAGAAYLGALPKPGAPPEVRLQHALAHVASADPLVAGDAFAEVARFGIDELERRRGVLPRKTLRQAIESDGTPGERVGLYGFLLGLCGTAEDAAVLRERLARSYGPGSGAEGVAAGYLMLAGEDGLADLEARVLMSDGASPLLAAAVLEALAFLRTRDAGPFTRERLRQAACCALCRAETADLAVAHLAAAKEWEALADVSTLLAAVDDNADRARAGQVSATRFLLECRRDADAPADLREAAGRILREVASKDGDLIRRATHLSGGVREWR